MGIGVTWEIFMTGIGIGDDYVLSMVNLSVCALHRFIVPFFTFHF